MFENKDEQYKQLKEAINISLDREEGIINVMDIIRALHDNGFYIESDH